MIDNNPVCGDCYKVCQCYITTQLMSTPNLFQTESIYCGICNLVVEGECLVSGGKNFHYDCMKVNYRAQRHDPRLILKSFVFTFQCSECDVTLKGRYYTVNGKFICEEDYKVKLSIPTTQSLGPRHDLLSDTEE